MRSVFSLLGLFLIIACNTKDPKAESNSIYANFKMGDHEWYLTTPDSVKLYLFEYGIGPDTVLVLHGGFGAEHRYLKDAFEGLYDQFHFIFYDQRGSLRSPCQVKKITIGKHLEDIETIRKAFGIKQLNLFGHSNGTNLATEYLKTFPQHVKGFVMTACKQLQYPIPNTDTILKKIERDQYADFGEYLNRPSVELEKIAVKESPDIPIEKKRFQLERIEMAKNYIYDISKWREGKESYGPFFSYEAGQATLKSMEQGPYDNRSLYENHPYPITVIMGEMDMIDPGGGKFAYWNKNLKNVYHILIPEAAHDPWIDQPKLFKEAFIAAMEKYR